MVHLDRVDQPVRVHKVRAVAGDVLLARRGEGAAGLVCGPDLVGSGPVSAERRVQDDGVVGEVRVDVAARSAVEPREGRAEVGGGDRALSVVGRGAVGGRWAAAEGVGLRAVSGEEPDGNGLVCPLGRVDAASARVEALAVVLGGHGGLRTAGGAIPWCVAVTSCS